MDKTENNVNQCNVAAGIMTGKGYEITLAWIRKKLPGRRNTKGWQRKRLASNATEAKNKIIEHFIKMRVLHDRAGNNANPLRIKFART